MDFNQTRAKNAAIDTGAAVAGAVAGYALSTKATAMITDKAPASTLGKHVPAILLGLIIGAQAMDLVPDSPLIDSALQGAATVAGLQAVRQYSGANEPAALTATSGLAHIVNQYVPAFQNEGQAAALMSSAGAGSSASTGVNGLGNLLPYRDPAQAMYLAGQAARPAAMPAPRQLGNPAPGNAPKVVG